MARLLNTIWALMLNRLGISIFRTCFANAFEDDYGIPFVLSPPFTSFLIATGVYVIVVSFTLFPQSLRKPPLVFLYLYEFLVTAFILEFAIACLWTPIDVFVLSVWPENICHMLRRVGLEDAARTVNANKSSMTLVTNGLATTFFLITLHVTRAVDFKDLTENGMTHFLSQSMTKLWQRVQSEFQEGE
ncbi:uncharacterized protein LOC109851788 isoform X2 [Pseudomyrmex gracilis]|uniref:uncharacterized protein LOC109851788 isoform X2 n=1 Tax=Pseudomyrmex gracilis TaxID=219809 RepID=UPI0009959C50|nr:uncharacterized protein LOC109851788 isoform X2 [Pseudomyrmex gracilis]